MKSKNFLGSISNNRYESARFSAESEFSFKIEYRILNKKFRTAEIR